MLQNRKLQRDNFEEVHRHLAPDGGIENVACIPWVVHLCCCYRTDLSVLAACTHWCYFLSKIFKCSWKSSR